MFEKALKEIEELLQMSQEACKAGVITPQTFADDTEELDKIRRYLIFNEQVIINYRMHLAVKMENEHESNSHLHSSD